MFSSVLKMLLMYFHHMVLSYGCFFFPLSPYLLLSLLLTPAFTIIYYFFLFLSMSYNIWLYSWHHVINDNIVESLDYVICLWIALDFFLQTDNGQHRWVDASSRWKMVERTNICMFFVFLVCNWNYPIYFQKQLAFLI